MVSVQEHPRVALMTRRRSLGVLCCAFVAPVTGAAASATAPVPSPRAGAAVVIVGGSPAQRQLARLTALRVGGVTIRRVVFRHPSMVLRREHLRGLELVVSSAGKETLRAVWEQQLYVGIYLGQTERWPKAAVAAAATDQREGPVSRLRAYEVSGSKPHTMAMGREVSLLVEAVARGSARIVELRTVATPARAIALTLHVADPAAFLKHWTVPLVRLLERPRVPLLGYYLGVQDASGRLVWATSRLPDTGGVFAIPSLDACSPVSHGGMGGTGLRQPLPCPAR
jgi:hypothetical protein